MTGHEQSDHRFNRRVPIELKVHVQAEGLPEATLYSHDWSRQGVFLRTREPFQVGTRVNLSVLVPNEHGLVGLPAVVVRSIRDHQEHHRPPGMGLYFELMPPKLALFLSQQSHGAKLHPDAGTPAQADHAVVLLIGDTGAERLQTSVYLDGMGLDVAETADLEQAADLLDNGLQPKSVILFTDNLGTPVIEFLEKLHHEYTGGIQSVIVIGETGCGTPALQHHATYFVTRPVHPERLYALMGMKGQPDSRQHGK